MISNLFSLKMMKMFINYYLMQLKQGALSKCSFVLIMITCFFLKEVTAQNNLIPRINNSSINAIFTFGFVNRVYIGGIECDCNQLQLKSPRFVFKQDTSTCKLFEVESMKNSFKKESIKVYCQKRFLGRFQVVTLNPIAPFVGTNDYTMKSGIPVISHLDSIIVDGPSEYYSRKELNYKVISYDIEFYDSIGLVRKSKGYGKYFTEDDKRYFSQHSDQQGFYVELKKIKVELEHNGDRIYYYSDFPIK